MLFSRSASALRLVKLSPLTQSVASAPFTTAAVRLADGPRHNDTADAWRKAQTSKPLNPHMTNTNSTIANTMPSVGEDAAPPELLSSTDPDFVPEDSLPGNTEHATGGTQAGSSSGQGTANGADLAVGEIEGGKFRVEPLRRTGEDARTMRARLTYQSRKRGTLESDLLLSTFADANLGSMTLEQLRQYDLFLDENDWDIYYWTTQEPTPTSLEYAEGAGPDMATPAVQGGAMPGKTEQGHGQQQTKQQQQQDQQVAPPREGEWAQTVGTFKPAYRPVPQRWKDSEILAMLRKHVKDRSAGGVLGEGRDANGGEGLAVDGSDRKKGGSGGGLGFMPNLRSFD